ncbi:HAD-IC family P-type ATPase, partial [Mesonia sp. K4-1]
EKIQVRVGEKVPLDGILLSEKGSFNTAALTGESKPDTIAKGNTVFAGSINLDGVIEIETTKEFKDSSIARILDMVQNATAKKSKTELFIRKFARIYTPIVVFLAIGLTFLPYFFVDDYVFRDWLYRALIFLVISCPCALVISIPLGYFGGLGAASRNGILFKGASFLDAMTQVNTVVMDKTGT